MIYQLFANSLVNHTTYKNKYYHYNLVLDGGIFGILYQYGALIYLKELERQNKIKIHKISGTSSGAIMGCIYIFDQLDKFIYLFNEVYDNFKNKQNLNNMRDSMDKFINKNNFEHTLCNDKLFVSYFDIETKSQIIKHKYNSMDELKNTMHATSFLPFFGDGNPCTDQKLVDGIYPHVFIKETDTQIIWIKPTSSLHYLKKCITIDNEYDTFTRILDGIYDCHCLFTNNNPVICNFIENVTTRQIMEFKIREICWIIILFMIDVILYIKNNIPKPISQFKYYKILCNYLYDNYVLFVSHYLI